MFTWNFFLFLSVLAQTKLLFISLIIRSATLIKNARGSFRKQRHDSDWTWSYYYAAETLKDVARRDRNSKDKRCLREWKTISKSQKKNGNVISLIQSYFRSLCLPGRIKLTGYGTEATMISQLAERSKRVNFKQLMTFVGVTDVLDRFSIIRRNVWSSLF